MGGYCEKFTDFIYWDVGLHITWQNLPKNLTGTSHMFIFNECFLNVYVALLAVIIQQCFGRSTHIQSDTVVNMVGAIFVSLRNNEN